MDKHKNSSRNNGSSGTAHDGSSLDAKKSGGHEGATSSMSSPPDKQSVVDNANKSPSSTLDSSDSDDYYYDDEYDDEIASDKISILDLLDPFAMSTQIKSRLNNTVRRNAEQLRLRVSTLNRTVRSEAEEMDIDKLKERVLTQVTRLEQRVTSANVISLGEKLTFSFGLLNIVLIGYLIGAAPHSFHLLYSLESLVLLPIRFYTYKRKNYHYFLADLCYFANILNLIFIWLFPSSQRLYLSCYAFAYGSLSWAVVTWRNSLVLHSIDKTTSTFIHILPPTVFHVITHCLDDTYKEIRFPGAMQESWNMAYTLFWTSVAYFVWQSLYHYFITHRRKDKIKAGRITSFEHLRRSYSKTKIGEWVNGLPEPFPVVAFTGIQFSFQLITMMLCPIWFSNKVLSTIFLVYIMFTASFNGATYYLEIFGKRFQKELIKLQNEVAEYKVGVAAKGDESSKDK